MSLQYELFQIANSPEPQQLQLDKFINSEEYKRLSETDKLVYESLIKDCSTAATARKKFLKVSDNISSEVLIALGIPKKAAFFYWGSPGKE